MKIATIVNQKGGVCKTTICRNLGYLLAEQYNKKVLLIDLDSSGNLSNFFSLRRPSGDDTGASRVLLDLQSNPAEYIFETRIKNLFLMPGNESLGKTEKDIKSDDLLPQQNRLKLQLKKIDNQFDYCFIDCPPTVTNAILVINALACSDEVLIPCPANMDAIDGVNHIINMVNTIQQYYNDHLTIRGVIFSRISRKNIDRQLLNMPLAIPRFRTYIRESSALAEYSRANYQMFREYDAEAKGSHDMDNLAAEYLGVEFPHPEDLPSELGDFL
ncbi:MAG: ParA family protein [Oscillospiraceae bacterium]|nr:ParA family protein [Oscillospiraceae bacterium]